MEIDLGYHLAAYFINKFLAEKFSSLMTGNCLKNWNMVTWLVIFMVSNEFLTRPEALVKFMSTAEIIWAEM